MSVHSGPEVPNSGLIFAYDVGNFQKSWKGAPTTNLYPNSTLNYNIDNFTLRSSTELDPLGTSTARSWTITNTGAQAQFWAPYQTTTGIYTYSVWLKASSTTTVWLYPQGNDDIERTSVTVTKNWKRFDVTRSASTQKLVGGLIRIYANTFSGVLYTWGHQFENQPFATTYLATTGVATSRSNTQSIIDLTKRNTVTANSVTYASNGSFSFNGTTDHISTNSNCSITGSCTLTAVIKPLYTSGAHKTVICTDINLNKGVKLMNYKNDSRYGLWVGQGAGAYEAFVSTNINDGITKILTGVWNQSTGFVTMYLNGVQTGSINTGNTSATQLTDGIIKLGTDYWSDSANLRYQGDIFYAAIHDRALSALEVKQNFNALRGRFGI